MKGATQQLRLCDVSAAVPGDALPLTVVAEGAARRSWRSTQGPAPAEPGYDHDVTHSERTQLLPGKAVLEADTGGRQLHIVRISLHTACLGSKAVVLSSRSTYTDPSVTQLAAGRRPMRHLPQQAICGPFRSARSGTVATTA